MFEADDGVLPVSSSLVDQDERRILADLYRRYRKALSSYFRRQSPQACDIDDLVQEAFSRLARRASLATIANLEGYLFQTAASVLRDRSRRELSRRQAAHVPLDVSITLATDLTPERALLGKDALARLQQALEQLPERTRDVFMLRVMEELKYAEIASALGISVRSAERQMAKALAHVGRSLGEVS